MLQGNLNLLLSHLLTNVRRIRRKLRLKNFKMFVRTNIYQWKFRFRPCLWLNRHIKCSTTWIHILNLLRQTLLNTNSINKDLWIGNQSFDINRKDFVFQYLKWVYLFLSTNRKWNIIHSFHFYYCLIFKFS